MCRGAIGPWLAGLSVVVHAIGDRANDWLLNVYGWVAERNGARDRRFRIEHAQHLTPEAIGRFAELGWAEKRIGPERIRTTYAFRPLLDAGAGLMTIAPSRIADVRADYTSIGDEIVFERGN